MSTHAIECVPVNLQPHPNADSLSIVQVYGYQCLVKTADWVGIQKAFYFPPDTVVDTERPEFSWLPDKRIRAKKLRGVVSYGLLLPAPEDTEIGSNHWDSFGCTRYEPPEPGRHGGEKFHIGGEEAEAPRISTGPDKYDIENFERYHTAFKDKELVVVREKLDGSNCRVVFWDGELHVKSRNRWLKRVPSYSHVTLDGLVSQGVDPERAKITIEGLAKREGQVNSFWKVIERQDALLAFLTANPGTTVFGEIFGSVNRLKYFPQATFLAFDVFQDGGFLREADLPNHLSFAPVTYVGPYSFEAVKKASTGVTLVPGATCIREGGVVKSYYGDRVILKSINPDFYGV